MNNQIMCNYLIWLRAFYNASINEAHGKTIHLILYCHASHKKKCIKEFAQSLNINFYYIPAGYPNEMQPLDIKVFGALKANERVAFFKIIYENKDAISNKGTHILGA